METKTTQLSLKNSECQTLEDESNFLNCCKEELTKILRHKINCTIAGMEIFFPDNKTFSECQNYSTAKDTYTELVDTLTKFYLDFSKHNCPLPCSHGSYNFDIQYFNRNTWNDVVNKSTPEMLNTTTGQLGGHLDNTFKFFKTFWTPLPPLCVILCQSMIAPIIRDPIKRHLLYKMSYY
jgi:hypothetical protein